MGKTNVELLFAWLDDVTHLIEKHSDEPNLDSLAIAMEVLFHEKPREDMDDLLAKRIENKLSEINLDTFKAEEIHQALQLIILKGMKNSTQPNHMMTPESIALLIGYLSDKFLHHQRNLTVFDPVCGTANLLITVLNQLNEPGPAYGSEIDPTLIKLAYHRANLQKKNIELFHQDSLRPLLLDPVDLVVADLPVGYYPDDEHAKEFTLRAETGHSYAHHLLIEQSFRYVKEGGYLLFLVPEFLFQTEEAKKLHEFIHEEGYIQGLIRLPESAFTSDKQAKSIFIVRKKGKGAKMLKTPLLVDFPSFKNEAAVQDILGKMNEWFEKYYQQHEDH